MLFASLSVVAGVFMLISPFRVRAACFVGALAAIFSGAFTLALPVVDAIAPLGWVLFLLWIVSLPALVVCVIFLAIQTRKESKLLRVTIAAVFALLFAIPPLVSFVNGAALGIVEVNEESSRANKTCHPNPTALVGNWLTRKGNVIEVVKVR